MIQSKKGKASPQTSRNKNIRKQGSNRSQPSKLSRAVKQQPQRSVAAAYSTGMSQSEPLITRGPNFVRIRHKELVSNILGSQNYTVAGSYPLNPGMTTFLKWLPTQAVGWETYTWNSIEFRSLTRTGTNVPGSLALIPDYDAEDAAPSDEFSASSYKDLVEDAPWKDICCKLPNSRLHPLGKSLFLRYGAVTGTDIKTYDAGNLFVTTTDGTGVNWAKLWCYYDVTLHTPQLPPGGIVALSNVLHITGTTPTTANSFPNQTVGANSNSGIATVPATGEVITFQIPGRYLVVYACTATTSVTVTGNAAVSSTGSLVTSYYPTSSSEGGGFYSAGSASTNVIQVAVLTVTTGTTYTLNNTIVAGLGYDLTITALNSLTA
jgi:hypothetical protein